MRSPKASEPQTKEIREKASDIASHAGLMGASLVMRNEREVRAHYAALEDAIAEGLTAAFRAGRNSRGPRRADKGAPDA